MFVRGLVVPEQKEDVAPVRGSGGEGRCQRSNCEEEQAERNCEGAWGDSGRIIYGEGSHGWARVWTPGWVLTMDVRGMGRGVVAGGAELFEKRSDVAFHS